jgi:hypothetical protein
MQFQLVSEVKSLPAHLFDLAKNGPIVVKSCNHWTVGENQENKETLSPHKGAAIEPHYSYAP